jgi:tetratricopeptide (TPR) repeat protein
VLALFGARAWTRVSDWRSEDDVITHDVKSAPQSARIRSAYGQVLLGRMRVDEAVREFDRAIAIAPQFGEPFLYKAIVATAAGDRPGAAQHYMKAIRLIPHYITIYEDSGRQQLGLDLRESMKRYRQGADALERGDKAAAADAFSGALELAPDPECARQLSALLVTQNRGAEALALAERAIRWDPQNGEGHWLASGAHFVLGNKKRSLEEAEEAVRLGYDVPKEILAGLRRGR